MESQPPGASQSNSGATSIQSPTEIDVLDIYSVFFLLCSVSLVGFLTYKLIQFYRLKSNTAHSRRNTRYRVYIYALIIICESIRTVGQGLQLQGLIVRKTIYDQTFMWVLQNGPNLIMFTIACIFAYFWHEVYRGFDDSYEDIEKSNKDLKTLLTSLNVVVYLAFGYTAWMYLVSSESNYLIAFVAVILVAMTFGSGLIFYHGKKLHQRVMRLIQFTAQTLKSSSGFITMFRITLFCCLVKILNLSAELYVVTTNNNDFVQGILNISEQTFIILLTLNAVSCLLGELGIFVSLVTLLEIHAKKAKESFIEAESQSLSNSSSRSLMKESIQV